MTYTEVFTADNSEQYIEQINRLDPLMHALSKQALNPQGGDDRITAACTAIHQKIDHLEANEFREELIDFLINPQAPGYAEPKHAVLKLIRAIQSPLLRPEYRKQKQYPEAFLDQDEWSKAIDWIMDNDALRDDFRYDLFVRLVGSNKPQRYVTIPLITGMLRERDGRFNEPLRVLDFGCSLNMGLGKLAVGGFGQVEVIESSDQAETVNQEQTAFFNKFANTYALAEGVGIDIVNFSDPGAKWWARSNSGYPSEWLNPDLEAEFAWVDDEKEHENVRQLVADFSVRDSLDALELEQESYDVVMISTAAYELSPQRRSAAWKNALRYAKPDGIVIIQDFARVNKAGAIRFYEEMFDKPFKYHVNVIDKSMPKPTKEPYLTYENGRCKKVRFESGALAVYRAVQED